MGCFIKIVLLFNFLLIFNFVVCQNITNNHIKKIEYYEQFYDKIDFEVHNGNKIVNLHLINREDSAYFILFYISSLDLASSIYYKDSVTSSVNLVIRPTIDSDYYTLTHMYTDAKINAYLRVINDIQFDTIRNYLLYERWETYNSLRYFFDFLRREHNIYYHNMEPIDYFIFYSVLSSSNNFHMIESIYGFNKNRIIQPIIDLYISYVSNLLDCKYHSDCNTEYINETIYLIDFIKSILTISGMTIIEINEIDWKDISPELKSDKVQSFQDIIDGKHLE